MLKTLKILKNSRICRREDSRLNQLSAKAHEVLKYKRIVYLFFWFVCEWPFVNQDLWDSLFSLFAYLARVGNSDC